MGCSSSSPQHNNPVDGGVENKSLSSTRQAFVNNSSAERQQVSQTQKSSAASPSDDSDDSKANYVCLEVATNPVYAIPEDIKQLIKKDIAPQVLRKRHLTPSTYKDYFAAMLYAEDYFFEKWSTFCLRDVTLELHEASIYMKSSKNKNKNRNKNKNKNLTKDDEEENKLFVAFQYDSALGKRPFLLSRDFVHVRPSGTSVEPFTGILYRVVKSELVLAEFGDDFHSRHSPNRKYDVSFSFNRVCLKRSHQAIAAATETLFRNFLFPVQTSRVGMQLSPPSFVSFNQNLNKDQVAAVDTISRLRYSPPYLIEGPLCVISTGEEKKLSATGLVIKEAILKIYSTSPGCRILVNAPTNSTCDVLMRSLKEKISESEMFRANAAFRELDGVPYDILSSCPYEGECFTCPSLKKLNNFKVILSTYASSFRLCNEGISAGHFSHIFMVDASSATEPETMVALVNLASEKTVVVISGATGNYSTWVRSDIARQYGLRVSYFERLLGSNPWCNYDPMFVARIQG